MTRPQPPFLPGPQPLLPPMFPHWPGPPPPPSRVVLGAAVAAGVTAGLTVPEGEPGVGQLVLVVVFAMLTWAVRWHIRQAAPALPDLVVDAGWTAAAIGFAGVAAVRDAEWLVVLALLAAAACGSIAVAGRWFRSIGYAAVAVPVAALRGLPWVARGVASAGSGVGRGGLRIVVAAVVGLGLVAVFAALLADADAAFAGVIEGLTPALDGDVAWAGTAGLAAVGMVGVCFLLAAPPERPEPREVPPSRLRTVEWALPVGLVVAVFALFGAVQVAALLGGDAYVLATAGLTYAEYARSGFWQLLGVTVLALGVILAGSRWAPFDTRSRLRWRRGLLAALTVLTLVIVGTALSRMWLYQQAYGFTVPRLLVLVCEVWLGAGFVLVLASVLRRSRARPVRAMVVTGVVLLLALAWSDPERFVAEHNVARFAETGEIDVYYLSTLSDDAVPTLATLPEPLRSCTLFRVGVDDDDWRSANAARAAARSVPRDSLPPACP